MIFYYANNFVPATEEQQMKNYDEIETISNIQ